MQEAPTTPLTIGEAARRLGKSETTTRRLVDTGVLRAIRLAGGMRLIDAASVEALAAARR